MTLTSRYAHLPQFASPYWQSLLNDPIQLALENHTMEWGLLTTIPDEESLTNLLMKPVVQMYEEPKSSSRVHFMETPLIVPSAPLKEDHPSEEKCTSLMYLITPMQVPKIYPNPSNICTVIIYNLSRDTTHEKLNYYFSEYGVIEHIAIPKNNNPSKGPIGSMKGFAMIRFSSPQESAAAVAIEKSYRTQIEFAKEDRK